MKRHLYSLLLAALLIAPTIYMQNTYIGNYLQSPQDELFLRVDSTLAQLKQLPSSEYKSATLIHFYDPQCPCNWLAKKHIEEIHKSVKAGFEIVTITPDSAPNLEIPASPATAIINQDGDLQYFGVYGFGAFCSQDSKNLLDQVITDISREEQSPAIINTLGEGCYCRWSKR